MKRLTALLLALLAGCTSVPTSIVQRPTSSRPMMADAGAPADGAIYNAGSYRPMFEDRRARHIGDLLTINIVEKTSAVKANQSSASKTGSASFGVPGLAQGRLGATVGTNASNKSEDAGNQSNSNTFSGTIAVTVSEVLPNGNLIVTGEKQVALDRSIEYIRFSGMVSPDSIQPGNVVSSTLVADARVEYRTASRIDRAEMNSMLSRFFQSLLPF